MGETSIADKRGDANYEIVDLADFNLPFLGATDGSEFQELQSQMLKKKLANLRWIYFHCSRRQPQYYRRTQKWHLICTAREACIQQSSRYREATVQLAVPVRGTFTWHSFRTIDCTCSYTSSVFLLFTDFENGQTFKPARHACEIP